VQGIVGCGDHGEAIGQMVARVGRLETTLAEAEKVRRKLHNDLMEIRGNIRVYCRLRPCTGPAVAEPLAADAVRITVDSKPNDFYLDRSVRLQIYILRRRPWPKQLCSNADIV
jgi:Microtubule binding